MCEQQNKQHNWAQYGLCYNNSVVVHQQHYRKLLKAATLLKLCKLHVMFQLNGLYAKPIKRANRRRKQQGKGHTGRPVSV